MNYVGHVLSLESEFPGLRIVSKSDSPSLRVIDRLLSIVTLGAQSTFMTNYTTTIGKTIYVPIGWDKWSEERRLVVLRHERVHLRQQARYGSFLFSILYLFIPLPLGLAYFRAKFEREAYEETLRATKELYGEYVLYDVDFKRFIVRQFLTGAYGWMWPFGETVEIWYDETVKKIMSEPIRPSLHHVV